MKSYSVNDRLLHARLLRCAALLTARQPHQPTPLDKARRLAADWASPLTAASGPGPTGGHSDPTGRVATDRASGHHDPTTGWDRDLDAAVRDLDRAVAAVTDLVVTICHHAKPEGRRSTAVGCANVHCGALSDHDRGRCKACANHLRRTGRDRRCGQHRSA